MKKDELIALGIDEEVAKKIMAINGTDIENAKNKADKSQEIENLKSELKTTKETLEAANVQIKSFEGLDVEGIKKQATDWEEKYKNFETQSKAEKEAFEKKLADQQYDFKINEYVSGQKFTSEFAKKAYMSELKNQGFKLDKDGNLLGANEYTEKFKAENQGVFVTEEPPKDPQKPSYDFAAPTGGQPLSNDGFNFNFTSVSGK